MIKRTFILICLMIVLSGCGAKIAVTSCPPFPSPSNNAIDKIQNIHDAEVDDWVVRLFKLKKQLEICNTKK